MTQIATVERIIDSNYAEISVPRKSACGHDCEECAGCGVSGASVHAKASNPIDARPGQKVVVESDTKKMLRIVALVYLTPVVLFLLGYLLTAFLSDSVGMQYFVAILGFAAGIAAAIAYDRRLRARGGLSFTIRRLF
ncbi:SoxR reducing system RseC family protein [Oscillibacter sp.]|uniref:SoxR reducing system RseC family protein n=1 Tax=Oscillibacter sp. TaxID=1945593 RepID=UPI00260B5931|nr:SoxR reducing system RseC family protein [Oscillibacter sp.]MDD3346306.1 SoxR reducing system RseC family protein [Oscillibacter sp.]